MEPMAFCRRCKKENIISLISMSGHCDYCGGSLIVLKTKKEIDDFLSIKLEVRATYLGGHKRYFDRIAGDLTVKEKLIVFKGDNGTEIQIPLSSIDIEEVKYNSKKGFEYSGFFGIIESLFSKNHIKIPYTDENEIRHEIEFRTEENLSQLAEILYNNLRKK